MSHTNSPSDIEVEQPVSQSIEFWVDGLIRQFPASVPVELQE